jgi:ABC-type transport system involved in cytochrome c biogenesis permease subunit
MTASALPLPALRADRWSWFGSFTILFLIASQALGITMSPPDRDMGDLQKIMYVHVPAAWITMLSFFSGALLQRPLPLEAE